MEQSIRNEIPGTVKEVIADKVLSEVIVETAIGDVDAIITRARCMTWGLR
jgi:molybdopterin-binding protein